MWQNQCTTDVHVSGSIHIHSCCHSGACPSKMLLRFSMYYCKWGMFRGRKVLHMTYIFVYRWKFHSATLKVLE